MFRTQDGGHSVEPPLGAQFSGPPSLSLSTLYCGFWAEVLFLAPDCKVLQENNACLIFLGIPETCLAAGMDRHSTIPRTAWLMTEVPGKSSYPTPSHNPKISYTSQWPTCQVSWVLVSVDLSQALGSWDNTTSLCLSFLIHKIGDNRKKVLGWLPENP